jgi:hypothetical protein
MAAMSGAWLRKKVPHPWLGGPRRLTMYLATLDFEPELEQFAVDAWRAPKRIFDAHPPDQCAQLREDLRSPSLWARLPTPVGAKAGPMPTHERVGPDDCENLQDRGNPAVELDSRRAWRRGQGEVHRSRCPSCLHRIASRAIDAAMPKRHCRRHRKARGAGAAAAVARLSVSDRSPGLGLCGGLAIDSNPIDCAAISESLTI